MRIPKFDPDLILSLFGRKLGLNNFPALRKDLAGRLMLVLSSDDQTDRLMALAEGGMNVALRDRATIAPTRGGIDLNTSNGMQWKVSKDGKGVEMTVDPALIERIRHIGIDSLSPVIFRMTPITSIWPLVGLQAPAHAERLAGV